MVGKSLERYSWFLGVIAGSVILAMLIIAFVIIPSFKAIKKVETEIKAKNNDLFVLNEKLEKLKELKTREDELKKKEAIVNRAIPTKKEVGELFIQLEGIINETGGSNDGIAEGQGTSDANSAAQAESAEISAADVAASSYGYQVSFPDYKNFKKFLERSENALRFISLNNFSVSSSENTFSVNLSYKTYYRNQAGAAVPGEEGQQ